MCVKKMSQIFPSQHILDGIFEGINKNIIWRDINILHKTINDSFYPKRSIDDNAILLEGNIEIKEGSIDVTISIPRGYLNEKSSAFVFPLFTLGKISDGCTICSDLIHDYQLDIKALIPDFQTNPSISNLVDVFTKHFQRNILYRKGADLIEAVRPIIEDLNDMFERANEHAQDNHLRQDLSDSLKSIKKVLDEYTHNLRYVQEIYDDAGKDQKVIYSPEFEDAIVEYGKSAKFNETKDLLESMFNDSLISPAEYISGIREVATYEFEEKVKPMFCK
ncbi:hypothetical protein TRFO_31316 [Tritrichomonas foetus]|uniref:Uncharacterized protein n=1 Tax=Tritrichomonas foetus TaxID=1144522 RepID=A0A1J4JTJ7_9EUKA|nr:hypothetical protein TRFO_31316 [Tritrichomonas foetus]|eukprot:OHT01752.1 hypothetical protein TRFO_31316 [Tritrichomonas foetus]